MKRTFVLLVLALTAFRCDHEDASTGPCIHIYEEPVLNILSVADHETGRRLPAVWITRVLFESDSLDLLVLRQGLSNNVSYSDSGLFCIPPFGFGTDRGHYSLSLSADGYRDTVVTIFAAYAVFRGGCPSSSSGGTKTVIQMQPN